MRRRALTIRRGRSIADGAGYLVAVDGCDVAFAVDATAAKSIKLALRAALRDSHGQWDEALAVVRTKFVSSQTTRVF